MKSEYENKTSDEGRAKLWRNIYVNTTHSRTRSKSSVNIVFDNHLKMSQCNCIARFVASSSRHFYSVFSFTAFPQAATVVECPLNSNIWIHDSVNPYRQTHTWNKFIFAVNREDTDRRKWAEHTPGERRRKSFALFRLKLPRKYLNK